jgi:hypothetical protein
VQWFLRGNREKDDYVVAARRFWKYGNLLGVFFSREKGRDKNLLSFMKPNQNLKDRPFYTDIWYSRDNVI